MFDSYIINFPTAAEPTNMIASKPVTGLGMCVTRSVWGQLLRATMQHFSKLGVFCGLFFPQLS